MPLIYQTELTEVLFHQGSTQYVLVTFGNLGTRANGSDYFGRTLVEKNDITCIGFAPRYPHWFPHHDVSACIPAIADILGQYRVITYGESMGGYAALKYSDLLGSEAVIAGSPQFSIDPADVPDDHRYRIYYNEALHCHNMSIDSSHSETSAVRRYILFDPFDREDLYNLSLIAKAVNITELPLRYTSHYSARVLGSSEGFKQFVALMLDRRDEDIRVLLRSRRKQSGTYRLYLGRQCSRQGHPEAAVSLMSSAVQLGADAEEVQIALAEHHERQGDLVRAMEAAKRTTELVPGHAHGFWLVGNLLSKQGQLHEAQLMYRKAIELSPGVAHYHFDLWSNLRKSGNVENAIEAGLAAEPQFSMDAHFLRHLAIMFRDHGDLIAAETRLRDAIAIDDRPADFHHELCDVLQRQGHLNEAITVARKAVAHFTADAHLQGRLASLLKMDGQLKEAELAVRDAITIDSRTSYFHHELCDILQRQGRHDDAIAAAEQAVMAHPNDAHMQFRLGSLLKIAGKLDEAERYLRQAIGLDHRPIHFHHEICEILQLQNRLDGAIVVAEAAAVFFPEDAHIQCRLGMLLKAAGRFREAEHHLERAIALDGTHAHFHRELSEVIQLQQRMTGFMGR
jgi:tetratricopeptide (TPR) repeat protein